MTSTADPGVSASTEPNAEPILGPGPSGATAAESIVETRGVTVWGGARTVLCDVNLTVSAGTIAAVVGQNGSGKSTLLRVLAGLQRPSGGRVTIGGIDFARNPARVRRLIGFVGDQTGLSDKLTPIEHLEMVAGQRGIPRADRRVAAESMVELVDLVDVQGSFVERLSHGQQRRLAIALALVHDPSVVILDEPLLGLDDGGRSELIAVFGELRAMGKTLIVASQSAAELATIADQVITLERGRVRQASSTRIEGDELTWVEVLTDSAAVVPILLELPTVSDVKADGALITLRLAGQTGEERARNRAEVAERLIGRGVRVAGFGSMPAEQEG